MNEIESRAENFSKELRELMIWEETEINKIIVRLKADNKILGLDGYSEEFAQIRQERSRRLELIIEKYKDLPLGTKLKLW